MTRAKLLGVVLPILIFPVARIVVFFLFSFFRQARVPLEKQSYPD